MPGSQLFNKLIKALIISSSFDAKIMQHYSLRVGHELKAGVFGPRGGISIFV